mgnify:FL=1
MKKKILFISLAISSGLYAQENIKYQKPSNEILNLVEFDRPPSIQYDDEKNYMLFLFRDNYKSIEELSVKEMRLGGLRIDPATNIGSRVTYYNNIKIKNLKKKKQEISQVKGLPENAKLSNISWSPDQKKVALTNTTKDGVELWMLNIETGKLSRLTNPILNANLGDVINWNHDSKSIFVKVISPNKKSLIDKLNIVPEGPTISTNFGEKAQNRTYQDLLKDRADEHNFEQLSLSEIHKVYINGKISKWLGEGMYRRISLSPDGNYVLITQIKKPFSYLVTYGRFPSRTDVYSKDGTCNKSY